MVGAAVPGPVSAPQWGVPCSTPPQSAFTTIPGPVLGIPAFASMKGCPPFPCFMPPPSFVMFMMQRLHQQQQLHMQGAAFGGMPMGWPGMPFPPSMMPPGCFQPPSLPAATSLAPCFPLQSALGGMSLNQASAGCDDSGRSCSSANHTLNTNTKCTHEDKADSNNSNTQALTDIEFASFMDSFLVPGTVADAGLTPVGDSALDLPLDLNDLLQGVDTFNTLNDGIVDVDEPCILDM